MSNLSRTASLFSTAVLGGMLLTTSITSVTTIAYAAETTITSTASKVAPDAIMTAEVPMAASDGMDNFFNATAKLAVKGATTDVTISFQDSKVGMLFMIPELTFDGITQQVNSQQAITFTIPTDDLKPASGSKVTLPSFTSVPMSPSKGYKSNLTFDLSSLLPSSAVKTGSFDLPVSADGGMGSWFDKTFSTEIGWLTSKVTVSYQASKQPMLDMISNLTFDNITKPVNGQRTITFDIPTKDLNPDADGIAKIDSFTGVPMSPSKGYKSTLSFNMANVPGESTPTDPSVPEVPSNPTAPEKPEIDTPSSTPDTSNVIGQDATYALNILRADKNEASMAATYMLPTIKLTKNADGSYYAYLTTHTPATMGQNPIRFNDTNHAATLMSTNLVNGYYQSVFRLTLSESEIKAPILTNIHVQFSAPLVYNENYAIRLVIGNRLSGDVANNNQNPSNLTNDLIVPRETGTMTASTLAATRLAVSPQATAAPETTTSDKKIKLAPATKKQVTKAKADKSTTKVAAPKTTNHAKISRATMIGAGVAITAAVGFVGASLALNVWRKH